MNGAGTRPTLAKEDKGFAEKLYNDLRQAGVRPWIDSEDLLPGQAWKTAIDKAIVDSSYFISILSSRSVTKKGYVQKEIRQALAKAEDLPEGEIFIIPVRIDECEPSFEALRRLQWTDLFPSYEKALKKLVRLFNYVSEEKPALVVVVRNVSGPISKLARAKGFGFIERKDLGFRHGERIEDLFFHAQELQGVRFEELREGDVVLFSIAEGPEGLVAVDVSRA